MTKTRQYMTGLVLGLGIGMASLIGFRVCLMVTTPDVPTFVTYGTQGRIDNPAKNSMHLNARATVDVSQIIDCRKGCS